MTMLYAVALVPVSLLPTVLGLTGPVYFWGVLGLSLAYAAAGAAMLWQRTARLAWARRVFLVSIIYLPALLTLGVVDKTG
jgi:protoheme IX farnesyltransferase